MDWLIAVGIVLMSCTVGLATPLVLTRLLSRFSTVTLFVAGFATTIPLAFIPALLLRLNAVRAWDESLYQHATTSRDARLSKLSENITEIGSITATGFLAIIVGLIFAYHYRSAIPLVMGPLAWFVSIRAQRLIDSWDGREHPPISSAIGDPGGYPSGGTLRVMLVLGILGALLMLSWHSRRERMVICGVVGLLTGLEAASRLILGRHWPMDLLSGVAVAATLLLAFAPLGRHLRRPLAVEPTPPQSGLPSA